MTAPCPTFGFLVTMDLVADLQARECNALRHAWIEFLERRGLHGSGGGNQRWEYVVTSEASQATDADCIAAREWLAVRPELASWAVGAIRDLKGGA